MSKRAIRIPSLRAGRRLRWTVEVSADLDGKTVAPGKAPKKRGRTKTAPRTATPDTAAPPATTPDTRSIPRASLSPTDPVRPRDSWTMAMAALTVVGVAALALMPRGPAPVPAAANTSAQPQVRPAAAGLVGAEPVAPPPAPPDAPPVEHAVAVHPSTADARKAAVPAKPKARPVENAAPVLAAKSLPATAIVEAEAPKPATAETAMAAPAPAPAAASAADAPVTITGCLEISVDQDQFRLTDTDGAGVAKARSWRSGFLKKRAAPVSIVDPEAALALRKHVGQRVAATGRLTGGELQPNSLRVVRPSCD